MERHWLLRLRNMQSRRGSVVETVTSTIVGFGLSYLAWQIVGPLMGYHVTPKDNISITAIFTVLSLARGYALRRLFNHFRT